MGFFGKTNSDTGKSETTVISLGARIDGEFDFEAMLHLDGEISGIVRSKNVVVIGKTGVLRGELNADKVVVNGVFEGELNAETLEILSGGLVNGNISVGQVSIENGGKFNGISKIKNVDGYLSGSTEEVREKPHKKAKADKADRDENKLIKDDIM